MRHLLAEQRLYRLADKPGSRTKNTGKNPRITNETQLSSRPDGQAEEADRERLHALSKEWADELLPDLVDAQGKKRRP